jgi:hypothetical protein
MTDKNRQRESAARPAGSQPPHEQEATDPGSYIGRKPERVEETIPGGLGPKDERASAVASQSGPVSPDQPTPDGHREGQPATDNTVREAGQRR